MALTRRNTLIGLGALAAGAGIIGGSGAFDAVEADRTFEVEVAGDAAALLGLEVMNQVIAGTEEGGAGGNDVIFFELDAGETASDQPAINEDAVTAFFQVFRVTNNGSQEVQVSIDTGDADGVTFQVTEHRGDNGDVVDDDTDLEEDGVDLNPGQDVTVDIEIDTTAEGGYTEPGDDPYEMTLRAESEDAQDD